MSAAASARSRDQKPGYLRDASVGLALSRGMLAALTAVLTGCCPWIHSWRSCVNPQIEFIDAPSSAACQQPTPRPERQICAE